jgi:hypothetical protein
MRRTILLACLSIACSTPMSPGDAASSSPDAMSPTDGGALRDATASDAVVPVDDGAISVGWRTEAPLPAPIQEICGATHGGRLWIAGGLDDGARVVAEVHVLDPATGEWADGPALPAPRHHAMMVSSGPDLFVLGGMETLSFEPLDTAWVLRAGATEWAEIAPLPEDRGAGAAGFAAGVVVIAGGNGRGGLAPTTLRYDPAGDTWTTGAAIPEPREHTSAFVHEGELWVVAGRRNSLSSNRSDVEIYDPLADTWRIGPPIPTARGGHGVAILDGLAYAIGGEQPDRALDSVERLDVTTGIWSAITPVPTPHHGHVVLAAAGRIWAIGGGDAPTFAAIDVVESFAP